MSEAAGTVLNQGSLAEWPLPHLLNFVFHSSTTGKLIIEPEGAPSLSIDLEEGKFVPPEGMFIVDVAKRLDAFFSDARAAFKIVSSESARTDFFGENLDPRTLIYPGIRDAYDDTRVDQELAPLSDRSFGLASGADATIGALGFSTEAGPVIDALRGTTTLAALTRSSPGREHEVKRVLLALFYVELVDVKGVAEAEPARSPVTPTTLGKVALQQASRVPVGGARRTAAAMAAPPQPLQLSVDQVADLMPEIPGAHPSPAAPPRASGADDKKGLKASTKGELAFEKGRFALRKSDYVGAEMAFKEAMEASARAEFRAYYHWARFNNPSYDKEAEAKSAVIELEAAIKEAPKLVFAHHFLGLCWKQLKQHGKAIEAWKNTLRLDDSHVDAQRELRLATMRSRTMPAVDEEPLPEPAPGAGPAASRPRRLEPSAKAGTWAAVPPKQKAMLAGLGGVLAILAAVNFLGGESSPPPAPPPPVVVAAPAPPPPPGPSPSPVPVAAPAAGSAAVPAVDILGLPAKTNKPGKLVLITNPPGADVWLGGKLQGRSPLVVEGPAEIVAMVLIKAGYASVRERVDLTQGAEITKILEAPGSVPPGPVGVKVRCKTENRFPVFVDGIDTGRLCPTDRISMSEGMHTIGLLVPYQPLLQAQEERVDDHHGSKRVRFSF